MTTFSGQFEFLKICKDVGIKLRTDLKYIRDNYIKFEDTGEISDDFVKRISDDFETGSEVGYDESHFLFVAFPLNVPKSSNFCLIMIRKPDKDFDSLFRENSRWYFFVPSEKASEHIKESIFFKSTVDFVSQILTKLTGKSIEQLDYQVIEYSLEVKEHNGVFALIKLLQYLVNNLVKFQKLKKLIQKNEEIDFTDIPSTNEEFITFQRFWRGALVSKGMLATYKKQTQPKKFKSISVQTDESQEDIQQEKQQIKTLSKRIEKIEELNQEIKSWVKKFEEVADSSEMLEKHENELKIFFSNANILNVYHYINYVTCDVDPFED